MSIKKLTKIIVALMVVATILSATSLVLASSFSMPSVVQPSDQSFTGTVGGILGVVTYICYGAAIILLVILGIKFMTASPDGKAEVKKSAVIYVVGAILVFAAGAVLNVIRSLTNSTIKG